MRSGYLSDYFTQVAWKRLTAVDADQHRSHQHEFGGVGNLRSLLGDADRRNIPTTFIYLTDDDPEPLREQATLSWYDSRRKQAHRGPEYRLYFPDTIVTDNATEGDLLIIGVRPDETLMAIIAEGGSTIAGQLLWLFGVTERNHPGYSVKGEIETNQLRLEFASRLILGELGVEFEESDEDCLEQMLNRFGRAFPGPAEFSDYAASTLGELDLAADPDGCIMAMMEREEILFRTLERHLIGDHLQAGFSEAGAFSSFSLEVQQRRRSRTAIALGNHLGRLFRSLGIKAERISRAAAPAEPDFLFPGLTEYHDDAFPAGMLTMLAARPIGRDRWQEVAAAAERICVKHLLTLEPSISTAQTDGMRQQGLQLVLPARLHGSYTREQQAWLMPVSGFVETVLVRQAAAGL